jgi:hypothetical protein
MKIDVQYKKVVTKEAIGVTIVLTDRDEISEFIDIVDNSRLDNDVELDHIAHRLYKALVHVEKNKS